MPAAAFAQNGYWSDHWTYSLDHVDSYLAIFPDKEQSLLWDTLLPFYFSPAVVRPRARRHVLVPSPIPVAVPRSVVRAYGAVAMATDPDYPTSRTAAMQAINADPTLVKDPYGAGGIWHRDQNGNIVEVSAICKIIMLAVVKFATLDPAGMGVEMEGGKPGWNDAMNGLPGLFGSGMPETYEMMRLLRYAKSALSKYGLSVSIPHEATVFFNSIIEALNNYNLNNGIVSTTSSGLDRPSTSESTVDAFSSIQDESAATFAVSDSDFLLWDAMNNAREKYHTDIEATLSGTLDVWTASDLISMLDKMIFKSEVGVSRALDLTGGLSPTYFYYEAIDYDILASSTSTSSNGTIGSPASTPKSGPVYVRVKAFRGLALPLFLEGPTRHLKVLEDSLGQDVRPDVTAAADVIPLSSRQLASSKLSKKEVYSLAKGSSLYDAPLGMFALCSSLASMGQELGRMKAFSPGWLENQSIWLHMSYKFYLELLRGGLYDEFFTEIKSGMVPFMPPERYGRSPLELSSFLPSSAFPDAELHGTGFLARLSGSTAEMLSIWMIMMVGKTPFSISSSGQLVFALRPVLPGWMFDANDKISFIFLGTTNITYYNPKREDSWKIQRVSYARVELFDGNVVNDDDGVLQGSMAVAARDKKIKSIDIYY